MLSRSWSLLLLGLCLNSANAAQDVPSFMQNMSGCFSVRFNFVENGEHDAFYNPILEKAVLSQVQGVIHLRRFLLIPGAGEQIHWREEWRLQDSSKQVWEQTVYGPFEDFRYRCSGVLVDSTWRCDAPGSPKPRRDADQPYAKLDRENTLKANSQRWVHMQKNGKRTQDGGLYAMELGWNQYDKKDDAACEVVR
jgi:hypothetical protein